jgi:(p)ppGpp synthase/HD superfamily hydrolase
MVEILKSKAQEPQQTWMNFVTTGKERALPFAAMSDIAGATTRRNWPVSSMREIAARMPGRSAKGAYCSRCAVEVEDDELMHRGGLGKD